MKKISFVAYFVFIFLPLFVSAESTSGAYLRELTELKKISGDRKESKKLHAMAMEKHKKKEYAESERLWYLTAKADPSWVEAYFNLACSTALQGKHSVAISYLEIALGMDNKKVLPWAKNDSDLVSVRGVPGYLELMDRYSGASRTLQETISILGQAITGNDPGKLMTIIDRTAGLRLAVSNGRNIDSLYEHSHIGSDVIKAIAEHWTPEGFSEMGHMSGGDPNLKVLHQQTNYRSDPPGSPMKCESWRDNFYYFKNINGSWFLIKIESQGNGGC